MAKLTDDQLRKSGQKTFWDSITVTSSPEFPAGHSRLEQSDGQTIDQLSPEVAPASHSVIAATEKENQTNGISGQKCDGSLKTAIIQKSLESKLAVLLDATGSLEYDLTWKHWDMASGPQICALRASARKPIRLSRKQSGQSKNSFGQLAIVETNSSPCSYLIFPMSLIKQLSDLLTSDNACFGTVAGWSTPASHDGRRPGADLKSTQRGNLSRDAVLLLAGWATPIQRDFRSESASEKFQDQRMEQTRGKPLSWEVGQISGSQLAATGRHDVLDPSHSRYLMGYPIEVDQASPNYQEFSRAQDIIEKADSKDTVTQ